MKVVNLGGCKTLLAEWDEVRRQILSGELDGWSICLHAPDGKEGIRLAGFYKADPEAALMAALRITIDVNRVTDSIPAPLAKN